MASVLHLLNTGFVKAKDLYESGPKLVTVASYKEATFEDGSTKGVINFNEIDEGMTLNQTRLRFMIANFGKDSDYWINKKVVIYGAQMSGAYPFQALIKLPDPQAQPQQYPQAQPQYPPAQPQYPQYPPTQLPTEDETPF